MSKEPKRNVYVGHRYVPLIVGEWDKQETYEGLSIVTFEGTSYTSKKRVPVGIDILDEEYWVVTGNYNAQIEEYRKDVREMKGYIDNEIVTVNENININKDEIDYTRMKTDSETINVKYPPSNLNPVKGDGVTPDSRNIQDIFDYAYKNGKSVFFPNGTYVIDSPIRYRPYLKINGVGVGSKLESHLTNGYIFYFDKEMEVSGPHGVSITNIFFDGKNHKGTGGGLSITSSGHGMVIEKCWFNNFSVTNQYGIYAYGDLYYMTIKECNLQNNYICIRFDGTGGGVNNCSIENCKITTGVTGISLIKAPNTLIKNCQIEAFNIGVDCKSSHVNIDTCWLEQNRSSDIRFSDCKNSYASHLYTYRVPSHENNHSIDFNNSTNCGVIDSYFNNRIGGKKPVLFGLSNGYNIVERCLMDDKGLIFEGPLGRNYVRNLEESGLVNRTDYPDHFSGGIKLPLTKPKNDTNGVIYDSGTGLVKIVDGEELLIPAFRRSMSSRNEIPTLHAWNQGDIVYNMKPKSGSFVGWVCVEGGEPGVWKGFGLIE